MTEYPKLEILPPATSRTLASPYRFSKIPRAMSEVQQFTDTIGRVVVSDWVKILSGQKESFAIVMYDPADANLPVESVADCLIEFSEPEMLGLGKALRERASEASLYTMITLLRNAVLYPFLWNEKELLLIENRRSQSLYASRTKIAEPRIERLKQPPVDASSQWKLIDDEIAKIQSLQGDWDSYGAKAISKQCLETVAALANIMRDLPVIPKYIEPTSDESILFNFDLGKGCFIKWEVHEDGCITAIDINPQEKEFIDIEIKDVKNFVLNKIS